MKRIVLFCLILSSAHLFAQTNVSPTDGFTIQGKIKQELKLSLANLDTFKTQKINDVTITNHTGEKRSMVANARGILLKNILGKLELQAESPKVWSEFYFVFVATDGYKIVFSWNEIFNTETGNNLFIVTEKDSKKINEMSDRILMLSSTDFTTGRRYLKGLTKILVQRVE